MKKTIINFYTPVFISITLVMLSACTKEIDNISYDSTYTRLIVEGYVTTDTVRQKVVLSKSVEVLDNGEVPYISNALVSISDGTTMFKLTEAPGHKGTYFTDSVMYGVPGRTYTLSIRNIDVNNDGVMEEYSARSELKDANPIDSFHVVYDKSNPHRKGWNINLYAMDKGGGRNFYLIKVRKNNVLLTDSVFKYSFTDNTGFEGKYYDGFQAYFLDQEKKEEYVNQRDTITVEMYGITEEYYNFIVDFILEYYPKIPIFSGPSANISTNIEPKDKAAGFFAVYSIRRKSMVYK